MRLCALLLVLLFIASCGMSESEARYKCYSGQIGRYQFDPRKSIIDSTFTSELELLSNLEIAFEKDSSFHANMKVYFLDDTVGKWDAGTCGFESSGKIIFEISRHEITFGPSRGDSFFYIQGKVSEKLKKVQQYYFRRI